MSTAVVRQSVPTRVGLPASITQHESPIVQFLARQQEAIEPLLPQGVSFPRVIYDVVAALAKDAQQKKPALVHCTPPSVFIAVVKIQAWGLEIGETAHLVPFGKHCEAVRDYKGKIQQAKDAGAIYDAYAHCVYENELKTFRYELGMHPILEHIRILDPKDRGKLVGVYAIVEIRPRDKRPLYMSLDEVDKIRQKHSKQWKDGPMPPWYMEKTVLHQALKAIPKNTRVQRVAAELEDDVLRLANEPAIAEALGEPAGPGLVRDNDGELVDVETGEIVDDTPDAEADAVADAKAIPFPFQKGKPLHGRPMGELPTDLLSSVAAWIVEKQDEKNDRQFHADTLEAINLIIADREKDQTALDLEEPPLPGVDGAAGAPAGSLSHTVPPPGLVANALSKREPAKAPGEAGKPPLEHKGVPF